MSHPHQLHALAALWSLRAARRGLNATVARQHATIGISAASTLRSPRYGVRHGSGGHSDPIGDALTTAADHNARYVRLADRTTDTLTWLTYKLRADGPGDPLGRLLDATPQLPPRAAAELARWALEADHDIRRALGIDADRRPLVGVACPSCGLRQLEAQTSPTDRALWTVICTAGEVCAGDACTCGMPTTAAGVTHIWDATSALVKRYVATVDA